MVVGSLLGFAALFGLAAQHTVRNSSAASLSARSAGSSAAAANTYFDEQGDGFSFGDDGAQPSVPSIQSQSQAPPIAQTSVS